MNIKMIISAAWLSAALSYATVVMDYNFNDVTAGTTVQANLSQYDYTSGQEYVGSNAVANTLGFTGGSTGTDYIIRDKGTGHENVLYWKTLNPQGTDAGIYFQKIDMTAGGANDTQVIRVSWSFDILGYDSNGGVNPSNWTVKVRTDNNSPNLDVSDAWYSSAVTAQTFSFFDDSTGETTKDGTWTTVSGYYDVAIGTGAALGGIQISTDNGAYTSAGGIFLDNILVDVSPVPEPAAVSMLGLGMLLTLLIRRLRHL